MRIEGNMSDMSDHSNNCSRDTTLATQRPVIMMNFVPEPSGTFRADIAALFGKYLLRHGIYCKLVGTPGVHAAVAAGAEQQKPTPKIVKKLGKTFQYWKTILASLYAVRKSECDLIQARDFVMVGFVTLCAAKLKGMRFCYWMSFLMSEGRIMHARAQLDQKFNIYHCLVLLKGLIERSVLYRIVLPCADHIFVQSDAMAAYVQSKGIPAEKITAVPMGVDTEEYVAQEARGQASRPAQWGNAPVIVYLGTLIQSRSIETLIDAYALVRKQVTEAKLVLIGSSNGAHLNQALLDYAAQLGLQDGVSITGWLSTNQAWKLLVNADVAVSWVPRNVMHDVSSPTKLLEYLAAGIPCVANDIPDQVQVLNQSQAGWLVKSDAVSMAQGLIEVLSDLPKAKARAAAGPAYIEAQRSYRVIAGMVASQYRRIASF